MNQELVNTYIERVLLEVTELLKTKLLLESHMKHNDGIMSQLAMDKQNLQEHVADLKTTIDHLNTEIKKLESATVENSQLRQSIAEKDLKIVDLMTKNEALKIENEKLSESQMTQKLSAKINKTKE